MSGSEHGLLPPLSQGASKAAAKGGSEGSSHLKTRLGKDLLPSSVMRLLARFSPLWAVGLSTSVPFCMLAALFFWHLSLSNMMSCFIKVSSPRSQERVSASWDSLKLPNLSITFSTFYLLELSHWVQPTYKGRLLPMPTERYYVEPFGKPSTTMPRKLGSSP